ncbi:hypothetical protein E3P96_01014 [Wallemia ichthyophaga]|nr:hypothetical protein E3P96_01014 [Wallemia ichthyophaga]
MPSLTTLFTTAIGLPAALWTFKVCLESSAPPSSLTTQSAMLVAFQRRIIYMGYSPVGARTEELARADELKSGMRITKISAEVARGVRVDGLEAASGAHSPQTPILFYLQGNAGNPLSRLPLFERILGVSSKGNQISKSSSSSMRIIAFAPSSYWTSTRRAPTQPRLLEDYAAALRRTHQLYPHAPIILYGHSLGGSIATLLCAGGSGSGDLCSGVHALILENAFESIPAMVKAYFVSPKVPYYHLHPLVFDKWDALGAAKDVQVPTMVLVSGDDELVPREHGLALHNALPRSRMHVIPGALHENAYSKPSWPRIVTAFVTECVKCQSDNPNTQQNHHT